jgi:hypothetical protein
MSSRTTSGSYLPHFLFAWRRLMTTATAILQIVINFCLKLCRIACTCLHLPQPLLHLLLFCRLCRRFQLHCLTRWHSHYLGPPLSHPQLANKL